MADSTEILMLSPEGGLIGSGVHLCKPCADLVEQPAEWYADGAQVARTTEQFLDVLCPECRQNASKLFTPDPWQENPYLSEHTKHLLRVMDEQD
jgi:hypothetical protein